MLLTLRCLLLVACAVISAPAQSQVFPDKPIRFILGFGAGGPTDLSVRAIAAAAAKQLGQPLVVSNLTGAGGTLANAELARSPADGYTIAMITSSYKAMTAHTQKLGFDLAEVRTRSATRSSGTCSLSSRTRRGAATRS